MTENEASTYGDPLSRPFWAAAERRELLIQRCPDCGSHQFYPRPFCLACESENVEWVQASGEATIYSLTTIHIPVTVDLEPPYIAALVELEEGPRLLTNIIGEEAAIGGRVRLTWREREQLPPLPVFETVG